MNSFKIAFLAAGLLSATAAIAPASAASPVTEAFLANVTPNVDFLDRSSRFALENSKSANLKEFARGQAIQQTLAANDLYDIASKADAAPLQTGRSAASGGQAVRIVDNRLPMAQEDLDFIEGLSGPEFDEAFRAKQRGALLQVQYDYETYLAKGDDPALKAIAARELPKVRKQIASLSKV